MGQIANASKMVASNSKVGIELSRNLAKLQLQVGSKACPVIGECGRRIQSGLAQGELIQHIASNSAALVVVGGMSGVSASAKALGIGSQCLMLKGVALAAVHQGLQSRGSKRSFGDSADSTPEETATSWTKTGNKISQPTSQEEPGNKEMFTNLEDWWTKNCEASEMNEMQNKFKIDFIKQHMLKDLGMGHANIDQTILFPDYRALDVGCGNGSFTQCLARMGMNTLGIDPLQKCIDVANSEQNADAMDLVKANRLKFRKASIDDILGETDERNTQGLYDFISCSAIIEHAKDKQLLISKCVALLKPSGRGYFFHSSIGKQQSAMQYSELAEQLEEDRCRPVVMTGVELNQDGEGITGVKYNGSGDYMVLAKNVKSLMIWSEPDAAAQ